MTLVLRPFRLILPVLVALWAASGVRAGDHPLSRLTHDPATGITTLDMTISTEWSAPWQANGTTIDDAYLDASLREFAQNIFRSTEGRIRLGTLYVYPGKRFMDRTDVYFDRNGRASANIYMFGLKGGRMNDFIQMQDQLQTQRNVGLEMVHEAIHYLFGLHDEYREEGKACDPNDVGSPCDTDVLLPTVLGDHEANQNLSLPANYATQENRRTAQFRVFGASCWESLTREPAADPPAVAQMLGRTREPWASFRGLPVPATLTLPSAGFDAVFRVVHVTSTDEIYAYVLDLRLGDEAVGQAKDAIVAAVGKASLGTSVAVFTLPSASTEPVVAMTRIDGEPARQQVVTGIKAITAGGQGAPNLGATLGSALDVIGRTPRPDGVPASVVMTLGNDLVPPADVAQRMRADRVASTILSLDAPPAGGGGSEASAPENANAADDFADETRGRYVRVKDPDKLATSLGRALSEGDPETSVVLGEEFASAPRAGARVDLPVAVSSDAIDGTLEFLADLGSNPLAAVTLELVAPDGTTHSPAAQADGVTFEADADDEVAVFGVPAGSRARQGTWTLRLTANEDLADDVVLSAFSESELDVEIEVGDDLRARITVAGRGTMLDAVVTGQLHGADGAPVGDAIAFTDSDPAVDNRTRDGVYTASLADPCRPAGEYELVVHVTNPDGTAGYGLVTFGNEREPKVPVPPFTREASDWIVVTADGDPDGDGACGSADNCPAASNPGQEDGDADGLGDACDACPADATNDADEDTICGAVDNCPEVSNLGQQDADDDGTGDACDEETIPACVGDCDDDGFVEPEDVGAGISLALGRAVPGGCVAFDGNGDGEIRVSEIVRGVIHLNDGCPVPPVILGSIAGLVSDADTGAPVPNCTVTVVGTGRSASADDSGFFFFRDLPVGEVVVRFEHPTHASGVRRVTVVEGEPPLLPVLLAPVGLVATFDSAIGGTFRHADAALTIPPGAVVDGQGLPVTGDVQLVMTKLDARDDLASFPGSFRDAVDASGARTNLETFGFAEFELTRQGQPVNLAEGRTAHVEYVLPDADQGKFSAGQTIPLWDLDEATATWRQGASSPTGTVIDSIIEPGKLAWAAEIPHLSWWNVDLPWPDSDIACLTGLVLFGGNPVIGAHVTAVGLTYNGTTAAFTGAEGRYCIEVKKGSVVRLEIRLNGSPIPVATLDVVVDDASRRCSQGDCQAVPSIEVALASCVTGTVTDAAGAPVAGVTVYVVPGGRAVTDGSGSYCAPAPADTDVLVFALGWLAVDVRTPSAATCATPAGCRRADLDLAAPFDGSVVGQVYATTMRKYESGVPERTTFDARGLFFAFSGEGIGFPDEGDTLTTETVDGCTVLTLNFTLVCNNPQFQGCRPDVAAGLAAQDPGSPGMLSHEMHHADLYRGDPFAVVPPQPWAAGVFEPADGVDLHGMGFDAGQMVMLAWPGGADIGAFAGDVQVPMPLQVLTPDLSAASIGLTAGQPFTTTWVADPMSTAGFEIQVTRVAAMSFPSPLPGGLWQASGRAVAIVCPHADAPGTATVPATVTSRLSFGLAQLSRDIQLTRDVVVEVAVPLRRTGGEARVKLHGQAAAHREE